MGRTRKVAFIVEYRDQQGTHKAIWEGPPTKQNLKAWRIAMNDSFQKGGSNDHIGLAIGFVPHVSHAKIIHQRTKKVVAETTMPMFEVV